MGFIACLLFGAYQIGHIIKDPFQDTILLSVLCDAIHEDILANFDTRSSAFPLEEFHYLISVMNLKVKAQPI